MSSEQQKTLIEEANDLYECALQDTDDPVAAVASQKELLEKAASKYRLVAKSGLRSASLYFNLGNCCLQLGESGMAVGYLEQAFRFDPFDPAISGNLRLARGRANPDEPATQSEIIRRLTERNVSMQRMAWWVATLAWIGFWALIGTGCCGVRLPFTKAAAGSLLCISIVCGLSLVASRRYLDSFDAVSISDKTPIHEADGDAFSIVAEVAQGERLKVGESRGSWIQVQTRAGKAGWATEDHVFRIRS